MADEPRRRLAAIMFTDMVGFAGATERDEAQALRLLEVHNALLRSIFPRFHGTEVKTIGDAFLVEFESALEATLCGIAIQRRLREHNDSGAAPGEILVRVGIHLGDVVRTGGDVLGDAVNIASRIEPLAEPGGLCVSESVFTQVKNKLDATFEPLPRAALKSLQSPPAVYRVTWREEPQPSAAPPPRPTGSHRLAVLPFSNLSPDPQDEYFADGLTEELISELARVTGCQVIARTSVMGYKKAPKSAKEVGRELRADVLLEGSVRKSGSRLRVTAQLIDATSEAHLWTGRYDREFVEIFDLQSDVAARVADALRIELAPRGRADLANFGTRNLSAYEYYLKGREYWWQAGEANYRAAIRHFEEAIRLDPKFALAYCGLADSHALLGNHGYVDLPGALALAEEAARKALALDPNLPDAHASLAPILYNRYDWPGAVAELRLAVGLDSNNLLSNYWLAVAISVEGDLDEALQISRRVAALDPLARQSVLQPALFLYLRHEFRASLDYMDEVEQRLGIRTDFYPGLCELFLGHTEVALERLRAAATSGQFTSPARRGSLAAAYARVGRPEEARRALDNLLAEARAGKCPAGVVAMVYANLGDNDRAFEWFDRAYEEKSVLGVEDLLTEPLLEGVRTDARFPALLRKFHYAPRPAPPRRSTDS